LQSSDSSHGPPAQKLDEQCCHQNDVDNATWRASKKTKTTVIAMKSLLCALCSTSISYTNCSIALSCSDDDDDDDDDDDSIYVTTDVQFFQQQKSKIDATDKS